MTTHYTSRQGKETTARGIACVAGVQREEKVERRLRRAREALDSDPNHPLLRPTKQATLGKER